MALAQRKHKNFTPLVMS